MGIILVCISQCDNEMRDCVPCLAKSKHSNISTYYLLVVNSLTVRKLFTRCLPKSLNEPLPKQLQIITGVASIFSLEEQLKKLTLKIMQKFLELSGEREKGICLVASEAGLVKMIQGSKFRFIYGIIFSHSSPVQN